MLAAALSVLVAVCRAGDDAPAPATPAEARGAEASEPRLAPAVDAAPGPGSPRTALDHALQRYLDGEAREARDELQALLTAGPLPDDVRLEALLWLGDLLYTEGGPPAARNVFETLLQERPDYPIDAFQHAPDVVSFFESVRTSLATPPPAPPRPPRLPPRPWPWKTLLPAGIGYFVDDRPVTGAVVGGIQTAAFAGSVVTWIILEETHPPSGKFPEDGQEQLAAFRRVGWTNRATVVAAALAYLVPIGVETSAWAGKRRVTVAVGPGTVGVQGSF